MIIQAKAYAKINWILEVGKLRKDGYHELSTLFQTIDLHDELQFSLAKEIDLKVVDESFSENLPVDDKNLVIKAAKLLATKLDKPLGAKILLKKAIPLGGGLGGGSADGAVTLLALNKLWQANLSESELIDLGSKLGSDVPFFIIGGTAWGKGRGIELVSETDIEAPYLLLVNPRVEISTSSVYSEFDRLTNYGEMSTLATYFFTSSEMMFANAKNSLSKAAKAICPVIAKVEERLLELGAQTVLMSGSGATVWARFTSASSQEEAFNALADSKWLIIKCRAVSRSEYQQSVIREISES
jgi:4-diphosphocytidyl-2C-methyl-D-erythritol kinase